MPTITRFAVASLVALTVCTARASEIESKPDRSQLEFFEKNIRPVLASRCYKCHSAQTEKLKGGLLLDTREGSRIGGESGHAVVPGEVEESLLIKAIRYTDKDLKMPPEKAGGKLPAAVIADFEKWVRMGAPDPRDGEAKVVRKKLTPDEARNFWAFQPPRAVAAPKVSNEQWPRNDIDRFILAGLESKGLKPVGDADRRALIRRVYFDLVGLPPSPNEIEVFVNDKSPQAFEHVVDRLLASPQFGERWGRHWLDVARYAESTGKERNYTYPQAWRYRDYVIDAFNADKPYDRFIQEQIAGDLLPAGNVAERNAQLIATGFLAIGPKGLNEKNREQFRMDVADEQIDITTRAVMGLTVACARCHDHKFDPISQHDYYAMAGIFRSTETCFGTGGGKNPQSSRLLALATSTSATSGVVTAEMKYDEVPETAKVAAANKGKAAGKKKKNLEAGQPSRVMATGPYAIGATEGKPSDSPIYIRGEIGERGAIVPRGFVNIVTSGQPPKIDPGHSGRLELAAWLTSAENPLTARVMANRVWQHLFGEGLVRTTDNFGSTGERPSHPELLDYLSLHFVADGWSVKKLIRGIVLSHVYQLSSAYDAKNFNADPDNVLLWRAHQRRLDAECIRDAMLAASGQLDLTPPHTSRVAEVGDGYIGRGIRFESFHTESKKRSVYLPIVREVVPEALALFDFGEPSLLMAVRDVTNVPSQALYLMNDPFVIAQADEFGRAMRTATGLDLNQRINTAYLRALSRLPTEAERTRAEQYLLREYAEVKTAGSDNVADARQSTWTMFCQALFASAEFRYVK